MNYKQCALSLMYLVLSTRVFGDEITFTGKNDCQDTFFSRQYAYSNYSTADTLVVQY